MKILLWHVHGSWTTAFVQGDHDYLLPVVAGRTELGRGRVRTRDWPASVVERPAERLREEDVDVVVLQQPHEADLVERWTGRRPGRDVPAVYVEHNTPRGGPDSPCAQHPMAQRNDVLVVHVTAFNQLFWDTGRAPTAVIEHGVVDPGHRFTGELAHAATAINDPLRRGRVVGTDLLEPLAARRPLDVFGLRVDRLTAVPGLTTYEDLPQHELHVELARRRVYVHTARWTSLDISLIEAMLLGLPVVGVAAAEAAVSVPPDAGVVTTSRAALLDATARFVDDRDAARVAGQAAREHARRRWGLERFLCEWDDVLARVALSAPAVG
ncbi:glycosyltransferase [Nocardioides sp.]|uniref:glycosyltransferase n=1 Tax=Nocardioides sp. TaxID=35761 RepID=UPI003517CDB7